MLKDDVTSVRPVDIHAHFFQNLILTFLRKKGRVLISTNLIEPVNCRDCVAFTWERISTNATLMIRCSSPF